MLFCSIFIIGIKGEFHLTAESALLRADPKEIYDLCKEGTDNNDLSTCLTIRGCLNFELGRATQPMYGG